MAVHLSSFPLMLSVVAAGALLTVLSTSWFRSRALANVQRASDAPHISEWIYTAMLWAITLLLGFLYHVFGFMPLRLSVPLSVALTLGVLGLIWPPFMHDPRLTPAQRFVQRGVLIAVSAILISIAAGHFGLAGARVGRIAFPRLRAQSAGQPPCARQHCARSLSAIR